MQSNYATGLSSSGVTGNIISSDLADVRIVGRNPQQGKPAEGIPFSLDIEVETYRDWFKQIMLPIVYGYGTCPDAVVVCRSADFNMVWGVARIRTSLMANCRGTARMTFNRDFRPTSAHRVVFELYPEGTEQFTSSEAVARSSIMTLDVDLESGEQAGIYAPPTRNWYQLPSLPSGGGALSEVNTLLKRVLIITGVGAGVYFLAPLMPGIQGAVKELASSNKGGKQ
jgi:hypothetical protein